MNQSESSNIKKSLKVTSLFGGVQILSILISIVRNKCVALLIGPLGIGLVELYNSTIRLIKSLTDFSLHISAVRDIAVAYESGEVAKFKHTVSVFSKIVWFTGISGTLVCLLGSPLWSLFTFGDYNHFWAFILLSCILLLNQLQSGKTVLLQGTQHYKYLAYSGIAGNVIGLITTVPIYFIWGIDGIIPVLIIASLTSLIMVYYYAGKINVSGYNLSFRQAMAEGRTMLKQGFLLSINFLLSTLVYYILRVFIGNKGGVEELGLYSASFAIVTTYTGMIFQSMGQEYYPRLSTLSLDNEKMRNAVDNQILLSLLILGPLIAIFLTFSDYLLVLLYSSKFTNAGLMMAISMYGILYQVPSWCMSYTFLAKGDNRLFLIFETIAKIIKLLLEIGLYLSYGLTGLGVAFVLSYIYYTIQCAVVCKNKYGFLFSRSNLYLLMSYSCIGALLIYSYMLHTSFIRIIIGSIVIVLASAYSYYRLNKIINISEFITKKLHR